MHAETSNHVVELMGRIANEGDDIRRKMKRIGQTLNSCARVGLQSSFNSVVDGVVFCVDHNKFNFSNMVVGVKFDHGAKLSILCFVMLFGLDICTHPKPEQFVRVDPKLWTRSPLTGSKTCW